MLDVVAHKEAGVVGLVLSSKWLLRTRLVKHDWDRHWSRFGFAVSNNRSTLYRRRLIWDGMRRQSSGARILDIGSGQGELAIWLAQEFPNTEISGVEYSAVGVDRSHEAATEAGIGMRLSFSPRTVLSAATGHRRFRASLGDPRHLF